MKPLPVQQTDIGCAIAFAERWEVRHDTAVAGIQAHRSHAVPWLHVARVVRFGRAIEPETARGLVSTLRRLASEEPVLRLHVEAWSERREDRETVALACTAEGFRRPAVARSYNKTVWIDLRPPEKQLLAGFSKGCRWSIGAPAKKGFVVREITDAGAAQRLQQIMTSTFRRTGGPVPRVPWAAVIGHAASPGSSLRLVGLFRSSDVSTQMPLSFALAYFHGEVTEYAYAGSVRDEALGNLPLLYAPTWDLMRWAKSLGALWWDFGGITADGARGTNKLAGINAFKRAFSTNVIDVGEEWSFEPRRTAAILSHAAGGLKAAASRLGGLIRARAGSSQERLAAPEEIREPTSSRTAGST